MSSRMVGSSGRGGQSGGEHLLPLPKSQGDGPRAHSPRFPSRDASPGFKNTKEPSCPISVYPELQELFLSLPQ